MLVMVIRMLTLGEEVREMEDRMLGILEKIDIEWMKKMVLDGAE